MQDAFQKKCWLSPTLTQELGLWSTPAASWSLAQDSFTSCACVRKRKVWLRLLVGGGAQSSLYN